jgi:molybdopterin molybdotransferase
VSGLGLASGAGRVPLELAIAWIDGATDRLEAERVVLDRVSDRVLAEDVRAVAPIPRQDCAALDGFAIGAAATIGAGPYNPMTMPSVAVAAAAALPAGTDAVVPFDQAEIADCGHLVVVEPAARGANVDRQGAVAAAGALLATAGTRLMPHHIGLLAAAGLACAPLVRRPRVGLALAGTRFSGEAADRPAAAGNGPMLRAAIGRDGGDIAEMPLADAFAGGDADIILVVGDAGPGCYGRAAAALAAAGSLDIDGVALVPGETTGFGRTAAGTVVVLLPGLPAACLWGYELFAGRAIRRLGGREPVLPYRACPMTAARKIVSTIGTTEICPVRLSPAGEVEPIASFAEIGLMAAAVADGFVIVPAASEGYPPGASVTAYLFR